MYKNKLIVNYISNLFINLIESYYKVRMPFINLIFVTNPLEIRRIISGIGWWPTQIPEFDPPKSSV